ncbi:MAG: aminoglycoside 6-adenylyltransferase [Dehalococcoidia bacterium]|nr:aminoglycoside 6-adenylyltransferase [Dehalococcoidia bacterium]
MPSPHLVAFIDDAVAEFESDPRVLAIWLEGSLARSDGDAYSDVDLHLAVADEDFQAFADDANALLGRLGEVIAYVPVPILGGALLPAAVASAFGPLRVDLMVEPRSRIASTRRRHDIGARFLLDRGDIEAERAAAPEARFDAAAYLKGIMNTLFFGALWPWRMTGRRDWTALLWNDSTVLQQFVVPAMLIADGSPEFHRELTTRPRFLAESRRRELEMLQGEMLRAFAGIEDGAPDLDALAAFHGRMFAFVFRSFREACTASGVAYPDAAEVHYRAFYERELGRPIALG